MKEILSPAEKIKLLRKEYGITQKELTKNGLKRTTLSMIETGSNNLTKKTGELLVNSINSVLKERGIDKTISLDYLRESLDSQIESRLEEYINELEKDPLKIDSVQEEVIYYKYQLKSSEVIFDISKKVGDIYFKQEKYLEALVSYTPIFENLSELKDKVDIRMLASTVFNCLASYYYLRKHRESLGAYKLIYFIKGQFSKQDQFLILKLFLSTKMEIGEYHECLSIIEEESQKMKLDSMEKMELKIIETECNLKLKNYYTTHLILKKIKKEKDKKLRLYSEIKEAIIYKNTEEIGKLQKSVDELMPIMSSKEESHIYKQELYYDFALCLLKLDRFEDAEYFLLKSINIYNSKNYRAMELLVKLYGEKRMKKGILKIKNIVLDFIGMNYMNSNDKIIFKITYILAEMNLQNEIVDLMQKVI
jgi:DNA-binding XRE family transcriptional regulator